MIFMANLSSYFPYLIPDQSFHFENQFVNVKFQIYTDSLCEIAFDKSLFFYLKNLFDRKRPFSYIDSIFSI